MFRKDGNEIFAVKTGRVVCTIDGAGKIVMAEGMAGPYKSKVEAWVAAGMPEEKTEATVAKNAPVESAAAVAEEFPEEEVREAEPEEMPAVMPVMAMEAAREELAPFDPVMGVDTPGFREYCTAHQMNEEEIAAMVRQLERRR